LVDRFAGSYFMVDYDPDKEMTLTYPYVFNVAMAIRQYLDSQTDVVESISLRTMLNFNRTYEQYMLYQIQSPYADKIFDNEGREVEPKSFEDSVGSFIKSLPESKQGDLKNSDYYRDAIKNEPDQVEFKTMFMFKYGKDPMTKADVSVEDTKKYADKNNIKIPK